MDLPILRASGVLAVACALTASTIAQAKDFQISFEPAKATASATTLFSDGNIQAAFLEGGRIIMRHSNGALSGVMIVGSGAEQSMQYVSSTNGTDWKHIAPAFLHDSGATQPALDANESGVYIAYVRQGKGHILDVHGSPNSPAFKDSGAVTNDAGDRYSFIAASRNGFKSVAYGWFDAQSGHINVGVSPDGTAFPKARTVVVDKDAMYGPAVGVLGRYVVVSYATRNPAITRDNGVPGQPAIAWVESDDSGATWSKPAPLYGSLKTLVTPMSSNGKLEMTRLTVRNVIPRIPDFNQSLVWADFTMANSRVFVSSTLQYTTPQGKVGSIGVVSFKMPKRGGAWTSVSAGDVAAAANGPSAPMTWFHQYSALPDTPVRAVSYLQHVGQRANAPEELVVALSTDTGKTFNHFAHFPAAKLGFAANSEIAVRTSACLWRNTNGDVSIDVLAAAPGQGEKSANVVHLTLPLGLNVRGHVARGQVW